MTCKIKYINDIVDTLDDNVTFVDPTIQSKDQLKESLSQTHIQLTRDILSFTESPFTTFVYDGVKYMTLTYAPDGDKEGIKRKTNQIEYINKLNKALNPNLETLSTVRIAMNKDKFFEAVKIDVSGLVQNYIQEDLEDFNVEIKDIYQDYEDWFAEVNVLPKDFNSIIMDNADFMQSLLPSVIDKIDTFLYQFEKSPNPVYETQYSNFKKLKYRLKNAEDVSLIGDSMATISTGISALKFVKNKIFGNYTDGKSLSLRIAELNFSNTENKQKTLEEASTIANIINESRNMYHLFSYLNEISLQISNVKDNPLYKYNLYSLSHSLIDRGIDKLVVDKLIKTASSKEDLQFQLVELGLSAQETKDYLKKSEYKNPPRQVLQELKNLMSDIEVTHRQLVMDSNDLVTNVLYNEVLKAYQEKSWESMSKKYNFPSKLEFKQSLSIASEDISITNKWLGGGLTYNDNMLRAVASLVNGQIQETRYEGFNLAKNSFGKIQELGIPLNSELKSQLDELFAVEYNYIDENSSFEEVDEAYLESKQPTVTLDTLFGEKTFKAKKSKQLLNQDNTAVYEMTIRKFKQDVEKAVSNIQNDTKVLSPDEFKDKYNHFLFDTLTSSISYLDKKNNEVYSGVINDPKAIRSLLWVGLFKEFKELKPQEEIDVLLEENNFDFSQDLLDVLDNHESKEFQFLRKNTARKEILEDSFTKKVKYGENLLHFEDKYLVQIGDHYDYISATVELNEYEQPYVIYASPEDAEKAKNVTSIFYFSGKFQKFTDTYNKKLNGTVQEKLAWSKIEESEKNKGYYEYLKNLLLESNKNLKGEGLRNLELPQIFKSDSRGIYQQIKESTNKIGDFQKFLMDKFTLSSEQELTTILTNNKGEVLNKDGEPILEGEKGYRFKKRPESLDGIEIKKSTPKFVRRINSSNLENDLFLSMNLFNLSSIEYKNTFVLDSQMNLVKSFLKGDEIVGQDKRKAILSQKESLSNKLLITVGVKKLVNKLGKEEELKSTDALNKFIDLFVYQDYEIFKKDLNILGKKVSAAQISKLVKSINSYQVLAFNLVAPITNWSIGTTNNYLLGAAGYAGLSEKVMNEAIKEYNVEFSKLTYIKDFYTKDLFATSKDTQLAVLFDVMKGDALEGRKLFGLRQETTVSEVLFSPTTFAEHKLQLSLMKALLKTYIVGKDKDGNNVYMEQVIKQEPGKAIEFNFDEVEDFKFSEKELVNDFQRKLEGLQRIGHGAYAQIDTALIQRHAIFSLGYQFSKWIYPSFKARFGGKEFDWRISENIEEGYIMQYMKHMISDLRVKTEDGVSWNINLKNLLKTGFNMSAKHLLYMGDYWTNGKLSKNQSIEKLLYGEKDEEFGIRQKAFMRTSLEMSLFLGAMLLSLGLQAMLDDDEDEGTKKLILQHIELQTKRYLSDQGTFMPFLAPFVGMDFMLKKMKDPFSLRRQAESTVGLLSQLFWIHYDDDEGWELNTFETYKKDGVNYDKGDSKVYKKLQKSVISPVYQIMRLFTPEQDLQFLQMINKNS